MTTYGYVRVSSADQNENRQTLAMSGVRVPTKGVFIDKQSGKAFGRPEIRPPEIFSRLV